MEILLIPIAMLHTGTLQKPHGANRCFLDLPAAGVCEMIELLIESVKPLGGYSKDTPYKDIALLILATPLFNV